MANALRRASVAALMVWSHLGIPVHAQSEQVWPEIDAFVKLNDRMRFYFLATTVKETRLSTEGEFGPNFDFYLSPLSKQQILNKIHPDESKDRLLMLRVGYRYIYPYTGYRLQ